ncbi:MAG: response regulator transcription factor [Actinomycetota bacterium]|nr:response regulator transcription factor [Actinomycetota bacterium]
MASRCLVRAGFAVEVSPCMTAAVAAVRTSWPDLVVLNPGLPGDDGLAFQRLRACSDVPVVMINPRGDEHERCWGLTLGADDFVPNPVSPEELVARVRSVLRRASRAPTLVAVESERRGPLAFDVAGRRVCVQGTWMALTALEFRLLAFLAGHAAQAFSRQELLERVWGYTVGNLSTVTVHVRRLREKIEPDPAQPVFLVTVWGVGYCVDLSGTGGH